MALHTRSSGPRPARIMIVGEAPGAEEEKRSVPFVGQSGEELTRMLHDAGIVRSECFLTNVSKYRPYGNDIRRFFVDGFTKSGKGTGTMRTPGPEIRAGITELAMEIREVKPNVIIALGNIPLWALQNRPSAKSGIADWRGSELMLPDRLATMEETIGHSCVVVPTYHPAAVLREWSWRALVVHDLRARVKKYVDLPQVQVPDYRFTIRPTFNQTMAMLDWLILEANKRPLRLAADIETRHKYIACIGFAWSKLEALCIPFSCIERPLGYWSIDEETAIVLKIQDVLTHPNIRVIGQNFLYDAQHIAKHWGFKPRVHDDTMLMQHVAYAGMEKGLDFLSSIYCPYHRFWKHEGKDFGNYKTGSEQDEGWTYNCKDAVITYEVAEVMDGTLKKLDLTKHYRFQMEIWHKVFQMMLRGVRIDKKRRGELAEELLNAMMERQQAITFIAGHPLNPASPPQMRAFFYDDLKMPVQYSRKGKNADGSRKVTLDEEALEALVKKEPLLKPIVQPILELRSLGIAMNVSQMKLDPDDRARCYFNVAGAETYRWSSSESAFGTGTNLQNLSRGLEDEEEIDASELKQYKMPNIRRQFIPDPGYTIAEVDQAGADAQVVAWEANDEILKELFRAKLKLHVENGKMMYGSLMGPDGRREPYYTRVKTGVHQTNYGATPRTLSMSLGISIMEAEKFQKRWFEIHPPIKDWQERVRSDLAASRTVRNKFGFRRYYFDRVESILPEALAWVPQSTVAVLSNIGIANTTTNFTEQAAYVDLFRGLIDSEIEKIQQELVRLGFQALLQVHDSIVFQYPTRSEHLILPLVYRALHTTVPYDDPLVIPWGLKTSTRNWGDCEERKEWKANGGWPPVDISKPLLCPPGLGAVSTAPIAVGL